MLLSPSENIVRLTGLFNINLHYANLERQAVREGEGASTPDRPSRRAEEESTLSNGGL